MPDVRGRVGDHQEFLGVAVVNRCQRGTLSRALGLDSEPYSISGCSAPALGP
ncbi:MAG: hypothetical protein HOZ81_39620 [Streptomyces sp.]|nr:hypothetical protein [Streptomyces sp.]NUP66361.1 hypothetical protein [Nonomuraea sp.]NUS09086.1 hypothetical protein [Nonomuraea sp.]